MDKNNSLGFLLGAAIGGVVAYYAFKHQDEIISKIHDLEENLDLDHNALIDQAKTQFEQLAQNVRSAITRSAQASPQEAHDDASALLEEIERLRAEVAQLELQRTI